MASVFTRIWNILRGKTDVLLDKLEKPEEQVRVFVTELNEQVQDMQRSVASAIADEKRLQKQVESLRAKSDEWESRAIAALEAGDDALAKTALVKQAECDSETLALEDGWRSQKEATEKLKASLKLAKSRMDEARRKYNLLLARYKSAQTKKQIQDSLMSANTDSPLALMESLEEKIRDVEAQAEAQLALGADSLDVDVEARFHELDKKNRGEEALDRLKSKLEERRQLQTGGNGEEDRVSDLKQSLDS